MKFEEIMPALRAGQAARRSSHPVPWTYVKIEDGALRWCNGGDDPSKSAPYSVYNDDLMADDWSLVSEAVAKAARPEPTQTCPRRGESFFGRRSGDGLQDHWRANAHNTDGKRSCSHCGSIHPDEFMQAVRDGVEIGPTDKNYKAYMSGPGYSHAKFYFQHLSVEQKHEFIELLNDKKVKIGFPGHFYVTPFFIAYSDTNAA